jgi:hypothetical protein
MRIDFIQNHAKSYKPIFQLQEQRLPYNFTHRQI